MSNSARVKILKALASALNTITITNGYNTDLYNNAHPKLKFWDEINQYPAIYMSLGNESRQYLPGEFKWGFINISIKAYVKNADDPAQELESLLEDIEKVIDSNRVLVYDTETPGASTVEILINSITSDEGLLEPYGVGELNITVQYQVLK